MLDNSRVFSVLSKTNMDPLSASLVKLSDNELNALKKFDTARVGERSDRDYLAIVRDRLSQLDLSGDIDDVSAMAKTSGGFCDVFLGHSRKYDKKVAIKKVRMYLTQDPNFAKVRLHILVRSHSF